MSEEVEEEEEERGLGGTLNSISQPSALPALISRLRENAREGWLKEREINNDNKHTIHLRRAANIKKDLSTVQISATLSGDESGNLVFLKMSEKKSCASCAKFKNASFFFISMGAISKKRERKEELTSPQTQQVDLL